MSNIRNKINSHIGTCLYFPEFGTAYEFEGCFPLKIGQTITITENFDTTFTDKYKAERCEPPTGDYVVHQVDSPALHRYNRYHNPEEGRNNWVRLSQRVTLVKKIDSDAE